MRIYYSRIQELLKEVHKHIDPGFLRQLRAHNKHCRAKTVYAKFGRPGKGLVIPSLLKVVIGVVRAPEREGNLRMSFGNYPVKKVDKDKSLVAFRLSKPNPNNSIRTQQ
jgi:hypothetical protein